jgi:hypothetical protein
VKFSVNIVEIKINFERLGLFLRFNTNEVRNRLGTIIDKYIGNNFMSLFAIKTFT